MVWDCVEELVWWVVFTCEWVVWGWGYFGVRGRGMHVCYTCAELHAGKPSPGVLVKPPRRVGQEVRCRLNAEWGLGMETGLGIVRLGGEGGGRGGRVRTVRIEWDLGCDLG